MKTKKTKHTVVEKAPMSKKREAGRKTVAAYGFRIDQDVYNTIMQIGLVSDRPFPYLANIAFKEFAEKYKGTKV